MPPKADWDKYVAPLEDESKPEEKIVPLSEGDIQVLRTYVSDSHCSVLSSGEPIDRGYIYWTPE